MQPKGSRAAFFVQMAAVMAVGGVCRKLVQAHRAEIQTFRNRALLTWEFFRATRVTGSIHQVSLDFIYTNHDRSPAIKTISGLWKHDSDQPDRLVLLPRSKVPICTGWGSYASLERMAMALARQDKHCKHDPRSGNEIIEALRDFNPAMDDRGIPFGESLKDVAVTVSAYRRAWDEYPMWPDGPMDLESLGPLPASEAEPQ